MTVCRKAKKKLPSDHFMINGERDNIALKLDFTCGLFSDPDECKLLLTLLLDRKDFRILGHILCM